MNAIIDATLRARAPRGASLDFAISRFSIIVLTLWQAYGVGHRDNDFAGSLEGFARVRGADVVHKHQVASLPPSRAVFAS